MANGKQQNPVMRAHDIGKQTDCQTTPLPIVCPHCGEYIMGHWTPHRTKCRVMFCQSCPWFFNLDAYAETPNAFIGAVILKDLNFLHLQLEEILHPSEIR